MRRDSIRFNGLSKHRLCNGVLIIKPVYSINKLLFAHREGRIFTILWSSEKKGVMSQSQHITGNVNCTDKSSAHAHTVNFSSAPERTLGRNFCARRKG